MYLLCILSFSLCILRLKQYKKTHSFDVKIPGEKVNLHSDKLAPFFYNIA